VSLPHPSNRDLFDAAASSIISSLPPRPIGINQTNQMNCFDLTVYSALTSSPFLPSGLFWFEFEIVDVLDSTMMDLDFDLSHLYLRYLYVPRNC
jgi:hypothetical protein